MLALCLVRRTELLVEQQVGTTPAPGLFNPRCSLAREFLDFFREFVRLAFEQPPVAPLEMRAQPGKQPGLHRLHLRLFDET